MLVSRVLEVGEAGPVPVLQSFLAGLMQASAARRLLGPVSTGPGHVNPAVLTQVSELAGVNPLLPLMQANAAALLRTAFGDSASEPSIAVLRPCEVRAAIELAKQGKLDLTNLILVGVDCLSTYEPEYWTNGKRRTPRAAGLADGGGTSAGTDGTGARRGLPACVPAV